MILGFLTLALLLFFSGLISYSELGRMRVTTQNMMDASIRNMMLSKDMLDGVQDQNTALLQMILSGRTAVSDSLWFAGRLRFEEALLESNTSVGEIRGFDSLYAASVRYNQLVNAHFEDGMREQDPQWFAETYKTVYYDLTSSIKNLMLSSQSMIDSESQKLERSAYRAIRPGIIALAIAIIIIIIFYYFINIFFIRPVLRMKDGLKGFLIAKIPFNVKFESNDEMDELRDYITELTGEVRKTKE